MIDKREILEAASILTLLPSVVEEDYVLGWVLGGIDGHPLLRDTWVFKGGTCLKKCYFETYRFSEDLDFTVKEESHLDESFLRVQLGEVVAWVSEQSGLMLSPDQISVDVYMNPRGKLSCQVKIGYRGPISPATGGWPKIKLDLTTDEKLVLPADRRRVFHPYSDEPEEGIWSNCYAYEEAFAEKVRALGERTRPRDLYDVVNLYRHSDGRPSSGVLCDVLRQKCSYKSIMMPTFEALAPYRTDLESKWESMLGHQLQKLPPAADFWNALPEIFAWIITGAEVPQRKFIRPGSTETPVYSRSSPMSIPRRARGMLEAIRFAAANCLCVDLAYDDRTRRIEPYSLSQTAEGNYALHAVRSDSGENRSYRLDRIQGASVTSQSFSPRYVIELTLSGPVPVYESAARPRTEQSSKPLRSFSSGNGLKYLLRCSVCSRTFERKSNDNKLRQHKDSRGNPCSGTMGIYVKTKY
jgi:predicted nucleotidyltransferase component of viral defense system